MMISISALAGELFNARSNKSTRRVFCVRAGTGDGLPSFYLFKRIASRLQKGFPEF
jgi:hypothetical protein